MKKRTLILPLLLLVINHIAFGQNNLDSLKKALTNISESEERVDMLNDISSLSSSPEDHLIEAITLSKQLDYEDGLTTAYDLLSDKLTNEGRYDSALTLNFFNLKLRKKKAPTDKLATTYGVIGLLYDYKGDYENAMINFLKGIEVSENIGDKKQISNFYNRIGIIYNYQGNYDKTLEYFNKSLEMRKTLNDKQGQADMYNNIGIIYRKKNDIDKAIEYYTKSLNIKKEFSNRSSIASSYNNLGAAYFFKHDYNTALDYYSKSLEIKIEENLSGDLASSYINIGETYIHLKDYKKAITNLEKGLKLAKQTGNRDDIKLGYEELAQAFAAMNLYDSAYQYHVLYSDLKDSIFNKESDERIVEMQTVYEVDKKVQEIELLQKENEIKRIEAESSNFIKNVFIIGFVIISFLVIAIIRSYRHDFLKNRLLRQKKNKIESQNEILKSMSYEKDQLMKIVAHDLRSPLNQIEGLVNLVNYSPENLSEEQKEALSSVSIATKHSKELISKILTTKSVDPSQLKVTLEKVNIGTLIQASIKDQEFNANRKNIKIQLDIESKDLITLTDHNYAEQIFENLISNAVKFSPEDKNIYIKVINNTNSIRVDIRDEGPGFTKEDKEKLFGVYETLSATPTGGETSIGLGLSIVKKYTEAIDAKVWCESEHGQGATFSVELKGVS